MDVGAEVLHEELHHPLGTRHFVFGLHVDVSEKSFRDHSSGLEKTSNCLQAGFFSGKIFCQINFKMCTPTPPENVVLLEFVPL